MTRAITITHDNIDYEWQDVPEKKYNNWVTMRDLKIDTTCFSAAGYPYMLQIEPTNFCNLACTVCPSGRNELNRERRHLTLEEFRSIIDDMEDYLLFLVMWDWGEPLMNPDLPAMIRYASDRGIKTVTSTNGHFFMDDVFIEALLQSGLSTLIVAIDSLSDANYKVYRRKGSLSKALDGLKNVIAIKRRIGSETRINMRMVIMKQNEHELAALRKMAKEIGADIFSVKTANPSCGVNSMDDDIVPLNRKYRRYAYVDGTYDRIRVKATCSLVWLMCNILSNGDIVPCCYDYNAEMKVGNIRHQRFSEIWNAPEYRALREKIYLEKDSIAKCMACGCNYELNRNGWFVESIDFKKRMNYWQKLQKGIINRVMFSNANPGQLG